MIEIAPGFHDGCLTGVAVTEGNTLLSLTRANGDRWEVRLRGVDALRMDGFRQDNIVLSIGITSGAAPETAPFERLFEAPHPAAAPEYHDAHCALVSREMAKVAEGTATLLVLTPSYGADLVALCRAVDCSPVALPDELFTVVCEFRGGTYISQVRGTDVRQALAAWCDALRRDAWLGDASHRVASEAEDGNAPTPLRGLAGAWCWSTTVEREFVLANIIRSG